MEEIQILVATHKKSQMPNEKIYLPIHVGRYGKNDLGYVGDDTGENISSKNLNFCELTGLYWYSKNYLNDSVTYIGLNHYRRYFLPNNSEFKDNAIVKLNFNNWEQVNNKSKDYLYKEIQDIDVILPIKRIYPISVKAQYSTMHIKDHLNEAVNIIKRDYPEYVEAADEYFNQNQSYLYNMFIMKKQFFIEMMEWIFDILFKLEKIIMIPHDKQQARVFGFLSERLINIFILKKQLKVKELPVAFISDDERIIFDNYKRSKNINNFIFKSGNKLWNYLFYTKNIKIKKSKSKK
ncbi:MULTISPECIES: DUF4422 domain-containing protein [unclassified Clostridium]|uniref:DUF4422 domain-containing protein n=1 Tax=unclassified Clostridium TaxID=2614128 RepID=UPI0013F9E7E4|nr:MULTISPECIES: DUF4422 domain-containing protein [unclassified Clostridium]NFN94097.1 DUF4422 domain-containing protein [Clostridium botulinum]NFS95155.1 DUF4422 domain-containing protein [Clostridium botulinum]